MSGPLSHHLTSLIAIRDAVKLHVRTGLSLGPDETARLVQRLNTVVELLRDDDEQRRIDGLALLAAQSWMRANRENAVGPYDPESTSAIVIAFPRKNGGDVA